MKKPEDYFSVASRAVNILKSPTATMHGRVMAIVILLETSIVISKRGYSGQLGKVFEKGLISGTRYKKHTFITLTPTLKLYQDLIPKLLPYYEYLNYFSRLEKRYEEVHRNDIANVTKGLSKACRERIRKIQCIIDDFKPEEDFKTINRLLEKHYKRTVFFVAQ
ncbi:MAG TPA: hypothetical protein VL576_02540 [Candidatus Paceibacterota bacterium]|jgi:hypothetical protein|nr:hypothetical protein [Candidatus Paceibacterota bacterium]